MPDRGFLPSDAPSLRAVLVDDEPAATSWVAELLNRHPYVEVVGTAEDATTAERLLDQLRPDVVFVDVQLPRRSGLTVLAFLVPGRRVAREPPAASGREGVSVASGGVGGRFATPPCA